MSKAKARVLAKLASKAPLLVVAGSAVVTLKQVQAASYRNHSCAHCGTEVAMAEVASFTPFCPSCSTEMTPGDIVSVQTASIKEEELASVTCHHCQTANVIEDRMLAAMTDGKMHCTACAGEMYLKTEVAGDLDPLAMDDMDSLSETLPVEEGCGGTVTAGEDDGGSTLDPDIVEDAEAIAKGVSTGARAVADALAEHQDTLDMDMTDSVEDDADLEIKSDEDDENPEQARLLAFADGVMVASLEKAHAGEHADIMFTRSFQDSVRRDMRKSGVKALASYGFKPVVVKVPVAQMVERRVQAELASEKAKVTASADNMKAVWDQSTKIAAAALNTGFYRNRTNPLADVLVATLQGMGFKQAKKVVHQALAQAGNDYIKALTELATEIEARTPEMRAELAQTLAEQNPLMRGDNTVADEMVDDSPAQDTMESVTARLSTAVTPVRSTRSTVTAAAIEEGSLKKAAQDLRSLRGLG